MDPRKKEQKISVACQLSFCFYRSLSSTLGEWLACLTWENVSHWTVTYHMQSVCHLYRPHNNQMMAILCLFDLESDKLRFLTVSAWNVSGGLTFHSEAPEFFSSLFDITIRFHFVDPLYIGSGLCTVFFHPSRSKNESWANPNWVWPQLTCKVWVMLFLE